MQIEISATSRNLQGTGASRRLRKTGRVPGIVYGAGSAAQAIELDHNTIFHQLRREAFHSSIIAIDIEGKKESVLLRDFQMHPYKPLVLHIDFQRVASDQKVHMKVPLHFINADIAPGVKLTAGIVSHVTTELEVSCLPANLPEYIEVDLKDLAVGHSIHISDLNLPEGVEAITHGSNSVVATILMTRGAASGEAEA
ncbi:MAG: 50S ribosomal protein L25/general stress protein Ctc [Burkholderiales bacterium]|nr:50S ribosomal protein L25/general stress protein Ctc [Burkholderiales bacterium]